jgi:hypothetical protein
MTSLRWLRPPARSCAARIPVRMRRSISRWEPQSAQSPPTWISMWRVCSFNFEGAGLRLSLSVAQARELIAARFVAMVIAIQSGGCLRRDAG